MNFLEEFMQDSPLGIRGERRMKEGKFSHVRVTETKVTKDHLYFEERANEGRKERKKA